MDNNQNQPTPSNIMQVGTGFFASKILLAAVKFELFTKLAEKGKMKGAEIKSMLGFRCIDHHVYDFLDALTVLGFLKRDGLLDTAEYSNSPDADFFLDKKKHTYIGGMLEMANNRLYRFWGNLEQGLLTGNAQNEVSEGETDPFGELYRTPEKLREFIHAMSGIQMGNFMAFAQKFDFSKYKTMADIGGSGALLSINVARHQPHMTCTSYDLPPVEPIAKGIIEHFGLSDRVKTGVCDFFSDNLPQADIITMGNILHDWDEEKKQMLVQKAFDALPEGGAFVAIENIIDDNRSQNIFGLMISLNMLIETGKGFDYTFAEFRNWATKAGFQRTEQIPLAGPASAAVAYK